MGPGRLLRGYCPQSALMGLSLASVIAVGVLVIGLLSTSAMAQSGPGATGRPSISDPTVRARLSEKLEEALNKSRKVKRTKRAGRDTLRVYGRQLPQPAKSRSRAKPKPKPLPPLDPLTTVIERAAARAHERTVQADLPPVVSTRWAYDGPGGPSNWSLLRDDYAGCGVGSRQSPVPLLGAIGVTPQLPTLRYRPSSFEVLDDGRGIVANLTPGNHARYARVPMRLSQVRVHRPGEHWLGDSPPDMSVHLIHETQHGPALIVAVSLMRGDEPNPALQSIIDALPLEPGGRVRSMAKLDASGFMPPEDKRGHYVYDGSLTTPPCTEGIRWLVMTETMSISAEQWMTFAQLFDDNARPLQPLAGRRIKLAR